MERKSVLGSFWEEGGKGKGLTAVATDAILNSEKARIDPGDEETVDGHDELDLAAGDQAGDSHIDCKDQRQSLRKKSSPTRWI